MPDDFRRRGRAGIHGISVRGSLGSEGDATGGTVIDISPSADTIRDSLGSDNTRCLGGLMMQLLRLGSIILKLTSKRQSIAACKCYNIGYGVHMHVTAFVLTAVLTCNRRDRA